MIFFCHSQKRYSDLYKNKGGFDIQMKLENQDGSVCRELSVRDENSGGIFSITVRFRKNKKRHPERCRLIKLENTRIQAMN